jgi:polysaccharide export outer membrane protein
VGKPGQYPYQTRLNVLTAVAMAGGFTVRADEHRMTVVRKSGGLAAEWHADRLAELQPGDLVVVPERFF